MEIRSSTMRMEAMEAGAGNLLRLIIAHAK